MGNDSLFGPSEKTSEFVKGKNVFLTLTRDPYIDDFRLNLV